MQTLKITIIYAYTIQIQVTSDNVESNLSVTKPCFISANLNQTEYRHKRSEETADQLTRRGSLYPLTGLDLRVASLRQLQSGPSGTASANSTRTLAGGAPQAVTCKQLPF
jgi:hypothetical protein